VRHEEEEAPLQVAHEASHAVQVAWEPTSAEKVPAVGHAEMQVPAERKDFEALVQLRHWLAAGPLQVVHEASHGSHTPDALACMPAGVHEARHEPCWGLKKGELVAQLVQWVACGPLQMAQLAWHGVQLSAEVGLPPAHVRPSSTWVQSPAQPSPLTVLLSSQASEPTRRPSPQMEPQVEREPKLPPEQVNPGSTWQVALHPSPASVLLSSHCSARWLQRMRMPSPHTGVHVSTPPMPVPCVLDDTHLHPVSTRQSESQPSPPCVLLSSHISADERMPLPQTWVGLL
jgi:hypothetical protein